MVFFSIFVGVASTFLGAARLALDFTNSGGFLSGSIGGIVGISIQASRVPYWLIKFKESQITGWWFGT